MSSLVNKAAVKTFPDSTDNLAVTGAASTHDLGSFVGGYCSFEAIGGDAYVMGFATEALADAATVTTAAGANRGYKLADGVTQDLYVPKNKRYIRVVGSGALTLQVWNTSSI